MRERRAFSEAERYGFSFGPIDAIRYWGDPKYGWMVGVELPCGIVGVQCTPSGRKATVTFETFEDGKRKLSNITRYNKKGVIE